MNDQLELRLGFEISAPIIRHHLERLVAQIDVPLVVPGVLPINLGRLAGGRVEAFTITSDGIRAALSFERGRRELVQIELHLSDVRFDSDTQTIAMTVARLSVRGLTPLSALVNPLRGQLIQGTVQAANLRVPKLLSAMKDQRLTLHVDVLTSHALTEAGAKLRTALEMLLPAPAKTRIRMLGLELKTDAVAVELQMAV